MSEHDEQSALFEWAALHARKYPELEMLYAIPNGGLRNRAVAGKLRAEGVKSGVFDVALDVGRGGYFGLRIELKARSGKPTSEQKIWLARYLGHGYHALICWGWSSASRLIEEYLSWPPTIGGRLIIGDPDARSRRQKVD